MDIFERYAEVKKENPDALLLFKVGDFYELFHDEAREASELLGLTLTYRNRASENPVPMAGFPYHQLDAYLMKLVQLGFRAAVCEQVQPTQTEGERAGCEAQQVK